MLVLQIHVLKIQLKTGNFHHVSISLKHCIIYLSFILLFKFIKFISVGLFGSLVMTGLFEISIIIKWDHQM